MVRVRIAPSPTGIPHIGNTRTALFNFLFARHNQGKFLLRIEDTDRKRYTPDSEKAILEILRWLDLNWDEEITRQSDRLNIYKKYSSALLETGKAYMDKGAVRFKMPEDGITSWNEDFNRKSRSVLFENKDQEDFIILKSDGYPTYNFANVIDDYLMKITHVIRGEEFIPSTPKHIRLYEAFGWNRPNFIHLPVVLGPDRAKLSKRHGAKSILDYRSEGYLKEALINYMALLGWSPTHNMLNQEIWDISTMIEYFSLDDLNASNAIFDIRKLEWVNGVWIRKYQISNLKSQILKLNPEFKNIDNETLEKFILLAQTRMTTLSDFAKLAGPVILSEKIKINSSQMLIIKDLISEFKKIKSWSHAETFEVLKRIMIKHKIKMPVLYKIFTGSESGLPLPQSLEILGKEKTLERLS